MKTVGIAAYLYETVAARTKTAGGGPKYRFCPMLCYSYLDEGSYSIVASASARHQARIEDIYMRILFRPWPLMETSIMKQGFGVLRLDSGRHAHKELGRHSRHSDNPRDSVLILKILPHE